MNGIVRGYMAEEKASLLVEVGGGHWDALEAALALQERGRWESMLSWLRDNGFVGQNLCDALKAFGGDGKAMADWVRLRMSQDAAYKPMSELPEGMSPAMVFRTR